MLSIVEVSGRFFQNSDMTIAEKVTQSANSTLFTLYKEGLFYKCYNVDAMLFLQKVKEYKVSSKFVKSAREKVYSIGFPTSEVDKVKFIAFSFQVFFVI